MLAGYRTYITAAVTLIVAGLVKFGFVTPEAAEQASQAITTLLENLGALILAFIAVMQIFQRKATEKVERALDPTKLPLVLVCCGMLALPFALAGCSETSRLTDPGGNPITPPGAVCVETDWGTICRTPPPPGLLAPPAPTPAPALAK